jgi:hypothetical protein
MPSDPRPLGKLGHGEPLQRHLHLAIVRVNLMRRLGPAIRQNIGVPVGERDLSRGVGNRLKSGPRSARCSGLEGCPRRAGMARSRPAEEGRVRNGLKQLLPVVLLRTC